MFSITIWANRNAITAPSVKAATTRWTAFFHRFGWRVPVRTAEMSSPSERASPKVGASMETQNRFAPRQKKNRLCSSKKDENGA